MKNSYEIRGDVTTIFINSPKYGVKEALISTNKLDRAKEFPNSWYVGLSKGTNTFYVQGKMPCINGKQKVITLHRWITGAPDGMQVDHRYHDGLNNLDDNLRVCTRAENQQNRKGAPSNSKSGIRGVTWHKRDKIWQSHVVINGKKIYLGIFYDIKLAERAVKEARKKYMPFSKEGMTG